ncbi:SPOR domain-containing protein [Frateuria defendens]|uniref:SPOR domain-containing protein n=1 Tax=Frateuria defendens TaxID=2219559 RepID=UPI00066FDFD4|nr:SPOR domain-containing protein [Frateuria defendens]
MVLRLLFVLLVAFNIAVGAWLLLGQDDAHGRSATDPGVPPLHLLAEQAPEVAVAAPAKAASSPPAPATVAAASVPPPASPASSPAEVRSAPAPALPVATEPPAAHEAAATRSTSYSCLSIGPFDTPQDLRNARGALAPYSLRMRSRQEQATQSRGWWVYLPASASRAQALALAARLDAAHVADYFVVNAGDQSNTVSLGLFKDPANARKRRDQVVAAGFPARMGERTESVPEYWLDVAVAAGNRLDWRSRIHTAGVGAHSAGCF